MMINASLQKYLQYSKRIAIFGIAQWAVLALVSLLAVLLSNMVGIVIDDFAVRVINNVVTCSSALAIAICSGYYAHSAYDNSLKSHVGKAFAYNDGSENTDVGNG